MAYVIFDNNEKCLVYDKSTGTLANGFRDMQVLKFNEEIEAREYIDNLLQNGDYPNMAMTVYEVHESPL